mgnify:CR=1 FL=1|jgi:hypothetical protein|tara:strand:- start:78 stop:374 length:297 start_codon:yes stop_codon:yes gene_type:complete
MKNNRRLKFEKKNLRRKNEIIRQNSKKVNDSPKPLNEVHIWEDAMVTIFVLENGKKKYNIHLEDGTRESITTDRDIPMELLQMFVCHLQGKVPVVEIN